MWGEDMAQRRKGIFSNNEGQSTVEAAFVLPVLLVAVLLLIQPGIVMYDRMIMRNAAAEGCRVVAGVPSDNLDQCEAYILRRLAAIPQQSLFHEHKDACLWKISLEGDETTGDVAVEITNKIKPLPLIGMGAAFLGALDDQGFLTIVVREEGTMQPAWAQESALSEGSNSWVGAWVRE